MDDSSVWTRDAVGLQFRTVLVRVQALRSAWACRRLTTAWTQPVRGRTTLYSPTAD